jgi:hypothetical protein
MPIFPLIRMIKAAVGLVFLGYCDRSVTFWKFRVSHPTAKTLKSQGFRQLLLGERSGALEPGRLLIELYRTQLVLISAKTLRLSAMAIF